MLVQIKPKYAVWKKDVFQLKVILYNNTSMDPDIALSMVLYIPSDSFVYPSFNFGSKRRKEFRDYL